MELLTQRAKSRGAFDLRTPTSWSFWLKEPKVVELLTQRAQSRGAFDSKSPKSWSLWLKEPNLQKNVCNLRTLSTLKWKLHGFFRVFFFKCEAPHFCSQFVQSSEKNDTLSMKLHGNGQKTHDLIFHRKIRWFWQISQKMMICRVRVGSSTEVNFVVSKVSCFTVFQFF